MASKKRKKKQPCYAKRISPKYEELIVAAIIDRVIKLQEYLDAEEISLSVYCQAVNEMILLKQFIRDYSILLPVDVNMKLLEY